MKITVPRDGAHRNCKRARAYPASRPQKREMPVETTAMYRVFHAHRGNMVSSNR